MIPKGAEPHRVACMARRQRPARVNRMRYSAAAACLVLMPIEAAARAAHSNGPAELIRLCGDDATVHATRGIVKSIDGTTLVVARAGNRGDIAFILGPTVHTEGAIVVGSPVSVRYRDEGRVHIATAVALQRTNE